MQRSTMPSLNKKVLSNKKWTKNFVHFLFVLFSKGKRCHPQYLFEIFIVVFYVTVADLLGNLLNREVGVGQQSAALRHTGALYKFSKGNPHCLMKFAAEIGGGISQSVAE